MPPIFNSLSGPMLTTTVPCTRLIITAGAWSPILFHTLFPASKTQIPISQLAGHSILLKNHFFKDDDSEICHAVFATDTLGFSPEYFSRAGGEVYLAGLNSTMIPLPKLASDSKPSPEAIKQLKDCAVEMMGNAEGREVEITREALCFRAVTSSGRPIVSRISDERLGGGFKTRSGAEGGVFLAAGHGAWGIRRSWWRGEARVRILGRWGYRYFDRAREGHSLIWRWRLYRALLGKGWNIRDLAYLHCYGT
jgi:glycine/D-amino acid oxidase-like deaminating enzyme